MTPAERFVREVERRLPPSVLAYWGTDYHVMPTWVKLEQLEADRPGSGEGSKAMAAIAQLADEMGVEVELVVEPDEEDEDSGLQGRLARFYGRYGFEATGGYDGEVIMKRRPGRRENPTPGHYSYLGQCDVLRRGSPAGERAWREMMHLARPTSRARFLRDANLSTVLDEGESPEQWLSGHPDARFYSSTWDGAAALFLQTAGLELVFVRRRQPNPIDPGAFGPYVDEHGLEAHQNDWTSFKLEEALNLAEERFGVTLLGPIYGCGMYGCAAPASGGLVLKVTIDDMEATWAKLSHKHQIPGMVRIAHPPVVVAKDDTSQGDGPDGDEVLPVFDIYAYAREDTETLSEREWRAALEPPPKAGPLRDIVAGVTKLAKLGYKVGDWNKSDNVGRSGLGKLVLRDGRARLLKKKTRSRA